MNIENKNLIHKTVLNLQIFTPLIISKTAGQNILHNCQRANYVRYVKGR